MTSNIEKAITEWAPQRVSPSSPLILYMVGHGSEAASFDLNKDELILSNDLIKWFEENFSEETKMLIIIDACYSGGFITYPGYSVSSKNRIIVTSCNDKEKTYPFFNYFSSGFWQGLQQGDDVLQAFIRGSKDVRYGHPWLDDNGDAEGHSAEFLEQHYPKSEDDEGWLATNMKIGVSGTPPSLPDIAVTLVRVNPLSITAGEDISVAFTMENKGDIPTGSFTSQIFLTNNEGIPILLSDCEVESIDKNFSHSGSAILHTPSDIIPGDYYITVWADAFDVIDETDETNNLGNRSGGWSFVASRFFSCPRGAGFVF